jgi:hypothetical protein
VGPARLVAVLRELAGHLLGRDFGLLAQVHRHLTPQTHPRLPLHAAVRSQGRVRSCCRRRRRGLDLDLDGQSAAGEQEQQQQQQQQQQ